MIHSYWKIDEPSNKNIATMLSLPPKYYKDRINKLGFVGKDTVLLDAGCGAGYWSIAASYFNKKVYGIDLAEKYLSYARTLKKKFNRANIDLKSGRIEKLPYEDKTFDYIICYSVWMFTDKAKALKEFYRVLKPGGKIYLGSIIGYSWYPKQILEGLSQANIALIQSSLKAMFHGIPSSEKRVLKLLEKNGFKCRKIAADGKTGNKNIKIKPIYNAKRWGMWEVFEVLAKKKSYESTNLYKNTNDSIKLVKRLKD